MSKVGKGAFLIAVAAAHVGGLYALSSISSTLLKEEKKPVIEVTMVDFVQPKSPPPAKVEIKKNTSSQQKAAVPAISQLVVQNTQPVLSDETVAPPVRQVSLPAHNTVVEQIIIPEIPAPNKPIAIAPQAPVTLSGDLSVVCPVRISPKYPRISLKMGEEGTVIVRVKLDKEGHVAQSSVSKSSGYTRLDNAALAAANTWQCTPAMRNKEAVEAYALQPFEFTLEGN